jgi:pSer/pThr/pTyr-binding forkhead associated (FHA) protein
MDDAKQATLGGQEPPFLPLKLVLQPSGPVVELTRPDMLMGRHSAADIRLPLPDVSRRHCRFVFTDHVWQVVDLESLNGIFVNGKRVQQATLHDQDTLTVGGFRFVIDLSGTAAGAGHPASAEAVIHAIAGALPRAAADIEPQRKAS